MINTARWTSLAQAVVSSDDLLPCGEIRESQFLWRE